MSAGAHERHIVRGTLAQQVSQGFGVLSMLTVVTLLARELSLREFGLFGLLIALASYLLVLQASVEGSAVRTLATAHRGAGDCDNVFSTTVALYALFGVVAGIVIAGGGAGLVAVLHIGSDLKPEAREAFLALGAVTAGGWPFRGFLDALRGSQRFVAASMAEVLANTAYVALTVTLVLSGAPLWAVIASGGSLPILLGLGALVVLRATHAPFHFHPSKVSRQTAREMLGFSAYLSAIGLADIITYSLDRVVLGAFKSTSTVGLFEGAIRPHALIRQLHSTLVVTVVPVASGFMVSGDDERLHDLLIRGTRYVLAAVVPVTVVLMVISAPLLDAWLGPDFRTAAPAMAIMIGYWILNAGTGVGGAMLVARGRAGELTRFAWAVALANLVISVALTPPLGLEGVALGTTIPYVLVFPPFVRLILREFPVGPGELARQAFLPAYATAAATAAAVGAVRIFAAPEGLVPVGATAVAGVAFAWSLYALVWMAPEERGMLRSLLRRAPAG